MDKRIDSQGSRKNGGIPVPLIPHHEFVEARWKTGLCGSRKGFFFLVRFSLKEDYERVLKDGPWFIGGHYLSIRNWEPNFKPSTASVSSIAMWVRLSELPIEYYEPLAL